MNAYDEYDNKFSSPSSDRNVLSLATGIIDPHLHLHSPCIFNITSIHFILVVNFINTSQQTDHSFDIKSIFGCVHSISYDDDKYKYNKRLYLT
jgi:hypothetical protein